MTGPDNYPDAAAVRAAFADHVDPGKVDVWALGGLEFVMGEREGATFTDAYDGRRWFNCHCNGGVFNLGHRSPRVIGAARAAMDHADIGNHHLVSAYRASAAERLSATTGDRLSGVVFSVGGVLLGMVIMGQTFSIIMTGIGIVALAGIVVNNNIVLIDTYGEFKRTMPRSKPSSRPGSSACAPFS